MFQTTETTQGVKNVRSEVVTLDILSDVGFFVLEFADAGMDAVPGAEQTKVLPYDLWTVNPSIANQDAADAALAGLIESYLKDLRLVGGDFVDVAVGATSAGAKRTFTITFDPALGNLPELQAFDTRLLVSGHEDNDKLSVRTIEQPTYLLGGTGQDIIGINVEIGVGGTIL
jgi:hypothetical protein